MSDRELLELAAKAAGHRLDGLASRHIAQDVGPDDYLRINEQGGHSVWNPLTDDGDALRLAVKLNLVVSITPIYEGGKSYICCAAEGQKADGYPTRQVENLGDPYVAARRAIVRAAAEIGKRA